MTDSVRIILLDEGRVIVAPVDTTLNADRQIQLQRMLNRWWTKGGPLILASPATVEDRRTLPLWGHGVWTAEETVARETSVDVDAQAQDPDEPSA